MITSIKTIESTKSRSCLTIYGVPFVYLALLGIMFAFLGFSVENAFKLINRGVIDSRFHMLPFIGAYGLISFAFHIILGSADNLTFFGRPLFKTQSKKTKIISNILCFIIITLSVFLSELILGNFWEIAFNVKLWNYSNIFMHVTKYASIPTALAFGTGAYLIFKFIYKPLLNFVQKKVSYKTASIICWTLGLLIVMDSIFFLVQVIFFKHATIWWSLKF